MVRNVDNRFGSDERQQPQKVEMGRFRSTFGGGGIAVSGLSSYDMSRKPRPHNDLRERRPCVCADSGRTSRIGSEKIRGYHWVWTIGLRLARTRK